MVRMPPGKQRPAQGGPVGQIRRLQQREPARTGAPALTYPIPTSLDPNDDGPRDSSPRLIGWRGYVDNGLKIAMLCNPYQRAASFRRTLVKLSIFDLMVWPLSGSGLGGLLILKVGPASRPLIAIRR